MPAHKSFRFCLASAIVMAVSAVVFMTEALAQIETAPPPSPAETQAPPAVEPQAPGATPPAATDTPAPSTTQVPDTRAATGSPTPTTDQLIAERERRDREDRRHHEGEVYIAGFGGGTLWSTTSNMEGRGTAFGQSVESPDLQDSVVYGLKVGYFHPGRLNWLGLEIEGYNSTPHLEQSGATPGTRLRLTTLGLNAIARTKMACRDRRDRPGDRRYADEDYESPLHENARCPLQLYAGAGLGVFFAETSNQWGRATENARAGLNALAGVKYFFNEHVAVFAEYKLNYVDLKFDQNQYPNGSTSGLSGTYVLNHFVGGLAWHF